MFTIESALLLDSCGRDDTWETYRALFAYRMIRFDKRLWSSTEIRVVVVTRASHMALT